MPSIRARGWFQSMPEITISIKLAKGHETDEQDAEWLTEMEGLARRLVNSLEGVAEATGDFGGHVGTVNLIGNGAEVG